VCIFFLAYIEPLSAFSSLFVLQFKLSRLELDDHARDKIMRLLGERYDPQTDMVTLEADR